VPLRIVHVTRIEGDETAPQDAFRLEVQYAESSPRAASAAVEATGKPVKVETDILWGSPDIALIDESRNAALICVGSVGIGAIARELWGSTAASLAERASCPVAIIRSPHNTPASGSDWIVAVVEDHADNESVIEHAMEEARLRKAPVLAVGVRQGDLYETRTTNWTAESRSGSSVTPMCTSTRWPPAPVSPGSWPTTATNRCSWRSWAAPRQTRSHRSSDHTATPSFRTVSALCSSYIDRPRPSTD
jgi:hypothetical protein